MIYEWIFNSPKKKIAKQLISNAFSNSGAISISFDNVPAGFNKTVGTLFIGGEAFSLIPSHGMFDVRTEYPPYPKLEFSGDLINITTSGDLSSWYASLTFQLDEGVITVGISGNQP